MDTLPSNPFGLSQDALDACAREPIHTPGSIQPHGMLIIIEPEHLVIVQVSINAADLLGYEPSQLLGRRVADVLGAGLGALLRQQLHTGTPGTIVPYDVQGHAGPLLALAHIYAGLLLLELLPEVDPPLADDEGGQETDSYADTISLAQQTRHLELSRRLTSLSLSQPAERSLPEFCQQVAEHVREISGYDRVMIYRFDGYGNGEVIAEARRADIEPFLGLCYPAADIPPQARLLYLRARVRALGDIYYRPVPLVPALNPLSGKPPDLSYCLLRSFSPVHLEYLHNMGVRATLTVSIVEQGRLWGLIACHHYTPKWPDHALRVTADLVSEIISMQISLRSQHLRAQAAARAHRIEHNLIRWLAGHSSWPSALREIAPDLPGLMEADGVAICYGEQIELVGLTPEPASIRPLLTWLQTSVVQQVLVTDSLSSLNPAFAALAPLASGLIALEIVRGEGSYVLWFRREAIQTVRWGGNPAEKLRVVEDGVTRLRPRSSFAAWSLEMRGRSRAWPAESHYLAEALRNMLVAVVLELLSSRHSLVSLDLLRIRRAVEASSEPIAITEPNGSVVLVNAAFTRLTGYDPQAVRRLPSLDSLPLDPILAAQIESAARSLLGEWQGELDLCACDGTIIPVRLRVDAVRDEQGHLIGQIRIYSDLRPQRQAEEERRRLDMQLLQAQKLESLGVLAGGIAHDFNNLLTAMLGHASLALLDLPPDSLARESIAQIELAAQRAAELSRQMLAYSGRGQFVVEPVDLNQIVGEMTQLLQTVISKSARLSLQLAAQLPHIVADVTQLRQVVMNLITNASDALGERGGTITLRSSPVSADQSYLATFSSFEPLPEGSYVLLEVADDGEGMSPATLERIFEPFYTTKFAGRGLGLAAVQGIVRGHKGAIRVESRPGEGTRFFVLLPSKVTLLPRRQPASTITPVGQGRIVLLVDDDASVRRFAQRVLERGGFQVLAAEDGRAALDIFLRRGAEVALVLLDLTMPVLSGMDTFRALREMRGDLPVLLCSGYSQEEAAAAFAGSGLGGFVQKPFRAEELLDAVQRLIG